MGTGNGQIVTISAVDGDTTFSTKNNHSIGSQFLIRGDNAAGTITLGGDISGSGSGNTIYSGNIRLNSDSNDSNVRDLALYADSNEIVTFSNTIVDGTESALFDVNKTGAGEVILSHTSNSFSGVLSVQNGTLTAESDANYGTNGAFGNATSAVLLGDTSGSNDANININTDGVEIGRNITVQTGSSGTKTLSSDISSGTASYTGTVTMNDELTLSAETGGTTEFTGDITDNSLSNVTVNVAGAGIVKYSTSAKTYTGSTSTTTNLKSGTLMLGTSDVIPNESDLSFSGGTLDLNGKSETVGVIDWTASSVLDFGSGSGSNTLTFSDDDNNGVIGTLYINNWEGAATDHFKTNSALTDSFLSNIRFSGFGSGAQVSGNDIIPDASASDFYKWDDGAGDDLWTSGANWQGEGTIGDDISPGAGDNDLSLRFGDLGAGDVIVDNDTTVNTWIMDSSATGAFSFKNDEGADRTITLDGVLPVIYHDTDGVTHSITNNSSNTLSLVLNEDLLIDGAADSTAKLVVGSSISGTGKKVTKSGDFELELSGDNTYTGTTTLSEGTITLSGSIDGDLVVNGGTLKDGTDANAVAGELTMNAGTISPGDNSIGKMSFKGVGDHSWSSGTYIWEATSGLGNSGSNTFNSSEDLANEASGIEGIAWDILSFSGSLDFSEAYLNSINLELHQVGDYAGYDFTGGSFVEMKIVEATEILNFNESFFNLDTDNFTDGTGSWLLNWQIREHDNALWLQYQSTPEPSTYLYGCGLTFCLLFSRWKSFRRKMFSRER